MSQSGKAPDALDRWRDESAKPGEAGEDAQPARKKFYQTIWFKLALLVIVILLAVAALIWWLDARQYEDTDDAFIDTHILHVAPQIPGQVIAVHVTDNQLVHKGDVLAELSSQDEQAKLDQVQAQGAQVETQYQQALASQTGVLAQARNAADDLARYRNLQQVNPQAVAQQQVDQAIAADRNARAQVAAAQAQVDGARAQIKTLQAQIAAAQINLGYTKIVAPEDGHVTQKSVALGNYVTAGQDLMTLVPLQLWVTANFKETQLGLMRPGQNVTLKVDACGDADVRGHIDSVQRGAGQAFGILPPQNATGNYVKVVQRVPVKIVLDSVPDGCPLGPGMSVEPTVKVR